MPPVFHQEGTDRHHFWQVNGSRDFGWLPAIHCYPQLPIRLHVGTPDFGEVHLKKHMNKWPRHMAQCLPAEVLYKKLESSGHIFETEGTSKFKVALFLKPSALLVVQYRYSKQNDDKYWSVISLHPRDLGNLDGKKICLYRCDRKDIPR